jgi:uncharacterized protein (DUF1778 family)
MKKKRGPGRPRTLIKWKGISVRFTADEKKLIAQRAKTSGVSQAELIRKGAVQLAHNT